jgi:hypothetical protein
MEFCCSEATWLRVAEALDMSSEEMVRNGWDLDVADCVRILIDKRINIYDRNAVEMALAPIRRRKPSLIDAVQIAAQAGVAA